MTRIQELSREIYELTSKIEQEYPELYQFLGENPATIPSCDHPQVDTQNFADYLESLKQLLEHHIETHPKR